MGFYTFLTLVQRKGKAYIQKFYIGCNMKRMVLLITLLLLAACAPVKMPTPRVEGTPVEIVQKYYAACGEYKDLS